MQGHRPRPKNQWPNHVTALTDGPWHPLCQSTKACGTTGRQGLSLRAPKRLLASRQRSPRVRSQSGSCASRWELLAQRRISCPVLLHLYVMFALRDYSHLMDDMSLVIQPATCPPSARQSFSAYSPTPAVAKVQLAL